MSARPAVHGQIVHPADLALQHLPPSIPLSIGVAPVDSLVMLVLVAVACSSIGLTPRGVECLKAVCQRLQAQHHVG